MVDEYARERAGAAAEVKNDITRRRFGEPYEFGEEALIPGHREHGVSRGGELVEKMRLGVFILHGTLHNPCVQTLSYIRFQRMPSPVVRSVDGRRQNEYTGTDWIAPMEEATTAEKQTRGERRAEAGSILFLIVITLALFSPALIGGKIIADGEWIGTYYPEAYFYADALKRGTSFFWNSHVMGGFPTYLHVMEGYLYPLHQLLFRSVPVIFAYNLAVAIPVVAGVIFSYLFARSQGLSRFASIIFGESYLLGQSFVYLFTGLFYANGFMVLPLLLYAAAQWKQSRTAQRSAGFFALGAGGAAVGFLAGFYQVILYGLTFAFFYCIFLDSTERVPGVGRVARYRATIGLVAMTGVGFLAALPQLYPVFRYLPESIRSLSYTKESSFFPYILPPLSFVFPPAVIARLPSNFPAPAYVGLVPLIGAAAALCFFRTKKTLFFFGGYFLMLMMGLYVPGFRWLNTALPVFSHVSNVNRWLFVAAFPFGFLGALGIERLINAPEPLLTSRAFRRFLTGFLVLTVLLGAAFFSSRLIADVVAARTDFQDSIIAYIGRGRVLRLPPEHYVSVLQTLMNGIRETISFTNWFFVFSFLLFPALFFLLRMLSRGASRRTVATGFVVLMSANLATAFSASYRELAPGTLYETVPQVAAAMKEREPEAHTWRFLGFLLSDVSFFTASAPQTASEGALRSRELFELNTSMAYGIDSVGGSEQLRSVRQNQLLNTVINPTTLHVFDLNAAKKGGRIDQIVNAEVLQPVIVKEKMRDLGVRLPLLSMMNVKYIFSLLPIEDGRLTLIPLPPNEWLQRVIYLYENKTVLSRVYFAEQPTFVSGNDHDLLIAMAETADFRAKTFIECSECAPTPSSRDALARVAAYENGRIVIDTENDRDGFLVISETLFDGWEARIDGSVTPLYSANYLYMSVRVPAGAHRVELEYQNPWTRLRRKLF